MTVNDGMILFAACVLSFTLGYILGVIRLSRFVNRELTKVNVVLARHEEGLQQFITKLGEGENKP
jgi:hypothetical protein